MSVLSRSELEASPLADLHLIASELGVDGFRRLRKADLVDAILARQGGEEGAAAEADVEAEAEAEAEEKPKRRRGTRGGRSRTRDKDEEQEEEAEAEAAAEPEAEEEKEAEAAPKPRRRRAARNGAPRAAEAEAETEAEAEAEAEAEEKPKRRRGARNGAAAAEAEEAEAEQRVAEGVIEILANGSGFLRISPPDPSDDDVYVSAAQIRRCELVSGDKVAGPVRAPRRSERYPSLVRVDTINGSAADEVAEGTHFDDLPAAFPTERFTLGGDDATLKAIEWLTPLGRGSRVSIVGGPRAGKTEALRRLAATLAEQDGLEVSVVLAGVRPEEAAGWTPEPASVLTLAASADAQAQAVERAVDTAKRIAARGGNAVVLIDTLDHLHPPAARKALAAARNIVDGGSLTVIATASKPFGGETTVIALDATLTQTGRFPALDLVDSGTLKPELLVGEAGADAIAQARAAALV
jgi:transcription termination factor Rho